MKRKIGFVKRNFVVLPYRRALLKWCIERLVLIMISSFIIPFQWWWLVPLNAGKLTFSNNCWPNLVSNTLRGSRKRLFWFYNQWQCGYQELKSCLGNVTTFCEGIPQFSEDLREINPKYNNLLVFDDLMREAVDSPVLSHLFSKGRHGNASTILLLHLLWVITLILPRIPRSKHWCSSMSWRVDSRIFLNIRAASHARPGILK